MPKRFQISTLETVAIAGVGLLGGSIGLALRAAGFGGRRIGIGRRLSSLRRAVEYDAVDEITRDAGKGVAEAQLVVVCAPISQFERLFRAMAPSLRPGTLVTDVASAKVEVMRLGRRLLPSHVDFVGSHPMAGSEKSGVEFSRADLFERATCIITPASRSGQPRRRRARGAASGRPVVRAKQFWEALGARTVVLPAETHDRLLARISHLPHAVASTLIALGRRDNAMSLAGPGFADTTRIASGEAALWTDIFHANRRATRDAIDELIVELRRLRRFLERDDTAALHDWLETSKQIRDRWVEQRYRRKELPP